MFWLEKVGDAGKTEGCGDDLPKPGEGYEPQDRTEYEMDGMDQAVGCDFDVTRSEQSPSSQRGYPEMKKGLPIVA